MIRGDRRDISYDKEENVYDDYKENIKEDKNKDTCDDEEENVKEDVYIKFYVRECDAEGTGYEPPVLAL